MRENVVKCLENLPYFTQSNLRLFQDNHNFSFHKNIQHWLRKGLIRKLKNGVYVTEKYYLKEKNITGYQEFIANALVVPSYISGEYVLQKYHLLTEATYPLTSITTKSTRTFENFLGTFRYSTVKHDLFLGFQEVNFRKNTIRIATKAKALFDFLYLKKNIFSSFSLKEIEELRFNTEELTRADLRELLLYIRLSKNRKLFQFYTNLKKILSQ
ncbi:hypothetical protein HZA41_01145 [Candidatus Peregrinibacteria bacterium]|nr:hypothetical protein [Candidatus Peregrinibacteria bacterium]